jgi:hypothetical protein
MYRAHAVGDPITNVSIGLEALAPRCFLKKKMVWIAMLY